MKTKLLFILIFGSLCFSSGFAIIHEVTPSDDNKYDFCSKLDQSNLICNFNIISEEEATVGLVAPWGWSGMNEDVEIPSAIDYEGKIYTVIEILNYYYNMYLPKFAGHTQTEYWQSYYVYSSLTIPASIKKIDPFSFINYVSTKKYIVDEDNENFMSSEGVLYSKNQSELIAFPDRIDPFNYTVPETVTTLYPYSFHHCPVAISLPQGITSIPEGTFFEYKHCGIELPQHLDEIGVAAFFHSGLLALTVPDGVEWLPESSLHFYNLEALTLPSSVI